ncbi:hypothetical protein D9M72_447710 [compost metagenome]
MIATPAASPSSPSMKLKAFMVVTISPAVRTMRTISFSRMMGSGTKGTMVILTPQMATTMAAALWPISFTHHRRSSRSSARPTMTISVAPARTPHGEALPRKMSLTKNDWLATTSATRNPA